MESVTRLECLSCQLLRLVFEITLFDWLQLIRPRAPSSEHHFGNLSQFIAGLVVGFIYGPRMAAVILASCPAIAISGFIFFMVTTKYNKKELDAYAKAGDVAEEVLSSIRTVTAFGGQDWL